MVEKGAHMSKKTEKSENQSIFDFEIATKREDAKNGFLDLKLKNVVRTFKLQQLKKNEVFVDEDEFESYFINQIFHAQVVAQSTINKDGMDLGLFHFILLSKTLDAQGGHLLLEAIGNDNNDEDAVKKYNKDCITVKVESLKEFYVEQLITVKLWASDDTYEPDPEQTKIDE